jgi:SAM-dependent methyltransferase
MSQAQNWDPHTYSSNARFVSDLAGPVLELLAPRPGERILDLGCGDGVLAAKLAALGCTIVGVDASAAQVEGARNLGVDARLMEGEALDFAGEFDAVFSNAALHWMRQSDAVINGVWRALRPGGRFIAEMGGHGNVARIEEALVAALKRRGIDGEAANPWYFPTVDDYSARLRAGGFSVEYAALIPRPTPLPGDVTGWLETFTHSFTTVLAASQRPQFIAEVRERLRPQLCDAHGRWTADYVRLRFRAIKAC